jgi:hypothetical protein
MGSGAVTARRGRTHDAAAAASRRRS